MGQFLPSSSSLAPRWRGAVDSFPVPAGSSLLLLARSHGGIFPLLSTSDESGVGEAGDFSLEGPREVAQLVCGTPAWQNLPSEGHWGTKGQVTPSAEHRAAQAGPAAEPCTVPAHSLPAGCRWFFTLASLLSSPLHSDGNRDHFLLDDAGKTHLIPFKGPLRAI